MKVSVVAAHGDRCVVVKVTLVCESHSSLVDTGRR